MPWNLLLYPAMFVAAGVPLWMRKVPPNPIYGLRIPATEENLDVWYEANAYLGRDLVVVGAGSLVVTIALAFTPLDPPTVKLASGIVGVVGVLVAAVRGIVKARALRKAHDDREV
jgi:uncharacterized membrane protein